jgi:hypothetical protein
MTDLQYQIGDGAQALDQQQALDRLDGWAVVSGLGVSAGAGLSVDVASGTTVVSGLDAPIERTVDIEGVLSSGPNEIVTRSDTLGEVRTSITYEVLKNVGGN